MSERLRRAYEQKEKAERKVRIRATDSSRDEQRLMGQLFKLRNPQFYPGYTMPRQVREELAERGLLPLSELQPVEELKLERSAKAKTH